MSRSERPHMQRAQATGKVRTESSGCKEAQIPGNHPWRLLNHLAAATGKHIKGPWQCPWRGWSPSGGRMSSLRWLAATSCWLTYQ